MTSFPTPTPTQTNTPKTRQQGNLGIKIIGIAFIIIAVLSILGALVNGDAVNIIRGVLFLSVGILLIKMKRWGFYILAFLFFVNFAQIFTVLTSSQNEVAIIYFVSLVVLGSAVAYLWSQRRKLT